MVRRGICSADLRSGWAVCLAALILGWTLPAGAQTSVVARTVEPGVITLGLAGDVMLGRRVNNRITDKGYPYPWGDLLSSIKWPDLTVINLVSILSDQQRAAAKLFVFKADPDRVLSLKEAGIDVCVLANSHILDYDVRGMTQTIKVLGDAGVRPVGAGQNLAEAQRPVVLAKKGVRVGILACTDDNPDWAARRFQPGVFYVDISNTEEVESAIRALRPQVDLLVLSMHWHAEMHQRPNPSYVAFAHRMIGAGVDLIYGHGQHIFQGIEVYQGKLILYDTGDFVDDFRIEPEFRNDQALLFLIDVDRQGVRSLELIPALIADEQVNLAPVVERTQILDKMQRLSLEFGTKLANPGGKLSLRLRER